MMHVRSAIEKSNDFSKNGLAFSSSSLLSTSDILCFDFVEQIDCRFLPVYIGLKCRFETVARFQLFNAQRGQHIGDVSFTCGLIEGRRWHRNIGLIGVQF